MTPINNSPSQCCSRIRRPSHDGTPRHPRLSAQPAATATRPAVYTFSCLRCTYIVSLARQNRRAEERAHLDAEDGKLPGGKGRHKPEQGGSHAKRQHDQYSPEANTIAHKSQTTTPRSFTGAHARRVQGHEAVSRAVWLMSLTYTTATE